MDTAKLLTGAGLGSCSRCNQLPRTGWIITTRIHSLAVLGPQVQQQRVSHTELLPEARGEDSSCVSSSDLPPPSRDLLLSYLCLLSYVSLTRRLPGDPGCAHVTRTLSQLHWQGPLFQRRSHSEVPEVGTCPAGTPPVSLCRPALADEHTGNAVPGTLTGSVFLAPGAHWGSCSSP